MDADIKELNFSLWFRVKDNKNKRYLTPTEVFQNLAPYTILSTYVYDVDEKDSTNYERTDYIDAVNIDWVPCSQTNWVRDIQSKLDRKEEILEIKNDHFYYIFKTIQNQGICINDNINMRFFFNPGMLRGMHMEMNKCGETNSVAKEYGPHITVPPSTWASKCTNDKTISDLEFELNAYEARFEIEEYDQPRTHYSRTISKITPKENKITKTEVSLRKIWLKTIKNYVFRKWVDFYGIQVNELDTTIHDRVVVNGQDPPPYWIMTVDSSSHHYKMMRSYKSIFYVFASVGGVSRGISMCAVLIYFMYNNYFYVKSII